ncbi:hypothetical protein C2R22_08950 [Salinigranum rubrum]|uniref:Uncharacterized protein n=1 Tax=Salinigranum rubrum TaxID=755307 RepID=A0A2I8VIL9_9EURY|nr:hypothetical protein C2R22_08950 [Salinigranum rubrum]
MGVGVGVGVAVGSGVGVGVGVGVAVGSGVGVAVGFGVGVGVGVGSGVGSGVGVGVGVGVAVGSGVEVGVGVGVAGPVPDTESSYPPVGLSLVRWTKYVPVLGTGSRPMDTGFLFGTCTSSSCVPSGPYSPKRAFARLPSRTSVRSSDPSALSSTAYQSLSPAASVPLTEEPSETASALACDPFGSDSWTTAAAAANDEPTRALGSATCPRRIGAPP